jgi:CBS domain-containing protein
MTIGSALERVPQLSISPERSVHEAAAIMSAHMVDAVPVITDEERLVGIITSADIVNWAAK